MFVSFGCQFAIDLTMSLGLGQVGSQSTDIQLDTVSGEFDVTIALYEDSSYTTVAGSNYSITVPDHVHVGIMLTYTASFLLQARDCWVTPDTNPANPTKYPILENGCKDTHVSLVGN